MIKTLRTCYFRGTPHFKDDRWVLLVPFKQQRKGIWYLVLSCDDEAEGSSEKATRRRVTSSLSTRVLFDGNRRTSVLLFCSLKLVNWHFLPHQGQVGFQHQHQHPDGPLWLDVQPNHTGHLHHLHERKVIRRDKGIKKGWPDGKSPVHQSRWTGLGD